MGKPKVIIIVVVFMALISFMCLSFGTSYSYMTRAKIVTQQTIVTGNFNVWADFDAIDNGNSTTLTAMSDSEGVNQTSYATITVSKDSSYSVYYTISLSYDLDALCNATANCTNNSGTEFEQAEGNLLPLEYIRFALFDTTTDNNNKIVVGNVIQGPMSIADLTVTGASNTSSLYDIEYNLYSATIYVSSATPSYSKSFVIKTWVDKDIDEEYDESLIYLKAKVTEEALLSKSSYCLRGFAYSDSTTLINNAKATAKVYGTALSASITSGETGIGQFTIGTCGKNGDLDTRSTIFEGTYLIDIYNNGDYTTTLHIDNGFEGTCSNGCYTTPENVGGKTIDGTGWSLGGLAYTHYTTISKILEANPTLKNKLDRGSNTIIGKNTDGTDISVILPNAYKISAKDQMGVYIISPLKFTATTDSNGINTVTIEKRVS